MGKFIAKKSMHLGFLKYDIRQGAILEDVEGGVIIDGKHFSDRRDFEILKNNDYIVAYSEQNLNKVKKATPPKSLPLSKIEEDKKKSNKMQVVQSDSDLLHEKPLPKVKKKTDENLPQAQKDKTAKLKVIKQEESEQSVNFSGKSLNEEHLKKISIKKSKPEALTAAQIKAAERKKTIAKNREQKAKDVEVEILKGAEVLEDAKQLGADTMQESWKDPLPK